MSLRVYPLIVAGGAVLLASCSSTPYQETRSPKAARQLASALAGRTARPPVRCLPNYPTTQMEVIDDWTILFKDGRTVYVQNPKGGCHGLGIGGYTLVTRPFGTNANCEGDISHLVDLRTGMGGGSCVFGPFTPYTR